MPARPDWGLGSSAKDLLRNFVMNINTHDMANQVISAANLDMSSYDLLSKLTVSAEPENFVIRVDVVDEDPQVAAKIVLTMAQLFVNERTAYYNTQDKRDRIEVKLVDSVIDAPLYRPNIKMNLVAGFALGALIGALIVLLLEWMAGDILATPEHVRRVTGLCRCCGAIPCRRGKHALRKTMTLNLATLTEPTSAVAEAYRRLRVNLMSADKEQALCAPCWLPRPVRRRTSQRSWPTLPSPLRRWASGSSWLTATCAIRASTRCLACLRATGVTTAVNDEQAALPLQATEVPGLLVLPAGPACRRAVGPARLAGDGRAWCAAWPARPTSCCSMRRR